MSWKVCFLKWQQSLHDLRALFCRADYGIAMFVVGFVVTLAGQAAATWLMQRLQRRSVIVFCMASLMCAPCISCAALYPDRSCVLHSVCISEVQIKCTKLDFFMIHFPIMSSHLILQEPCGGRHDSRERVPHSFGSKAPRAWRVGRHLLSGSGSNSSGLNGNASRGLNHS